MRERSKPSTAHCDWNLYTLFLLAKPKYVSCVRLGTILEEGLTHDSINRFLLRERYSPEDLFNEVLGVRSAHFRLITNDRRITDFIRAEKISSPALIPD